MLKNNQVVRFVVGRESFGVEIGKVQEIVTVPEITRVPDTPDFIEGIINLRGKIVSVVDLRKRLRFDGAQRNKKNRILVTELDGKVAGLIVDEVSEVFKLDPGSIEPPPEMVTAVGVEYITGVAKVDENLIILLDLARVLNVEDMKKLTDNIDRTISYSSEAKAA
jgi:purine-binding chemotaxis protein CheW